MICLNMQVTEHASETTCTLLFAEKLFFWLKPTNSEGEISLFFFRPTLLLTNDEKCDPLHIMEARLLHLITRLCEKIEREKKI